MCVFIVNIVVRSWNCDSVALSRDEPFTVYFSQLEIHQFLPIILDTNNPPTFELFLHVWTKLFGNTLLSLRMLPVLIVSLGAIPLYRIGQKIAGYEGAVMISLLYLVSSPIMNIAHLDRAYCILVTGSIFMLYSFILLCETGARQHQIYWLIAALITCYAHYFGWLTVIALVCIAVVLKELRQTVLRKILKASLLLLVAYLPLSLYILNRFFVTRQELEAVTYALSSERFISLIGEFLNSDTVTFTITSIAFCIGSFLVYKGKKNDGFSIAISSLFLLLSFVPFAAPLSENAQTTMLAVLISLLVWSTFSIIRGNLVPLHKTILLLVLMPLTLGFLISSRMPIFIDRYFSFTIPAILLSTILLLHCITHQGLRFIIQLSILMLLLLNFNSTPKYFVDHRPAVDTFRSFHAQSQLSIVGPGYFDFDFTYHYNPSIFFNGSYHLGDTLGPKIVHEEGYTRFKEGFRRELKKDHILISHDSTLLTIDTSAVRCIALFDGNLSLAYPENGLYAFLSARYGPPVKSETFEGTYAVHLFQK
jgi:hypothetical protein